MTMEKFVLIARWLALYAAGPTQISVPIVITIWGINYSQRAVYQAARLGTTIVNLFVFNVVQIVRGLFRFLSFKLCFAGK